MQAQDPGVTPRPAQSELGHPVVDGLPAVGTTSIDPSSPEVAGSAPGGAQLLASIVVTAYRRPKMLAELLDALAPQIRSRAADVIVVDNCPEASARAIVAERHAPWLHYLHETRTGVVHARNRGVAAARGTYVIFLDDDEVPSPAWLDAWLAQADGRIDASFGRIVPRMLAPCPEGLSAQVERNFSRDLRSATNADISDRWSRLGTGNTMFHRSRCLGHVEPFDPRFNARGGEDVWLIRSLRNRGHRLVWNHEAVVEELVPADRMTLQYFQLRRFNQGQLRCILSFGDGGLGGLLRVSVWMIAGILQFLFYRAAEAVANLTAPRDVPYYRCQASGGLGKLLWWHEPRIRGYGHA